MPLQKARGAMFSSRSASGRAAARPDRGKWLREHESLSHLEQGFLSLHVRSVFICQLNATSLQVFICLDFGEVGFQVLGVISRLSQGGRLEHRMAGCFFHLLA